MTDVLRDNFKKYYKSINNASDKNVSHLLIMYVSDIKSGAEFGKLAIANSADSQALKGGQMGDDDLFIRAARGGSAG